MEQIILLKSTDVKKAATATQKAPETMPWSSLVPRVIQADAGQELRAQTQMVQTQSAEFKSNQVFLLMADLPWVPDFQY